jgi:hypothetical protein
MLTSPSFCCKAKRAEHVSPGLPKASAYPARTLEFIHRSISRQLISGTARHCHTGSSLQRARIHLGLCRNFSNRNLAALRIASEMPHTTASE